MQFCLEVKQSLSDIHTVGMDLFSFSDNGMRKPVSRITLYVNNEDDQVYTAGDDTGLELSATCIYATQEMANTLLSMAKGAQYQMYEAQAANLDPAAELGDGIEVGGITSVIAQINDNGDGYPDVSASGEQEVEDEYPGASRQGPIQRELSRARSLISKTNERISFEIYGEDGKGGLNGRMNTFTMGLSGISNEIKGYKDTLTEYEEQLARYEQDLDGYSGEVSKYTKEVNGYKEQVISYKGSVDGFERRVALYQEQAGKTQEAYSLIDQKVTSIKMEVTNGDNSASIQLMVDGKAQGSPAEIKMAGLVSFNDLKKGSTTTIHGGLIDTDSIYANSLHLGGKMDVYRTKKGDTKGGFIGYFAGWESTEGIGMMESESTGQVICTDKAVRISHGNNAQVICMDDYLEMRGVTAIRFGLPSGFLESGDDSVPEDFDSYARMDKDTFRPYKARPIALGDADNLWTMLWADSCSCCPSDENKKNSIEDLPDKYLVMFDNVHPKRFKMNNGTSGRYHVGYTTQDVKNAMDIADVDSSEFGGWIMDTDAEGNAVYFLRYEEFGAIYAAKIKQLEARLEKLEGTA